METAKNTNVMHGVAINLERGTAEISLEKDTVYVVRKGKITELCSPESGHGKHTIEWDKWKPLKAVKSEESIKF